MLSSIPRQRVLYQATMRREAYQLQTVVIVFVPDSFSQVMRHSWDVLPKLFTSAYAWTHCNANTTLMPNELTGDDALIAHSLRFCIHDVSAPEP